MPIDIEEARANDDVGKLFEANYIPNTTYSDYDKAKTQMSNLLQKYGGREKLEKNEYDWLRYRKAMFIVYSYTHDEMEKSQRDKKLVIERMNRLAAFFDDHQHLIFDLSDFAKDAIRKYNEKGMLRGLENLELLYNRADKPKITFNNLGNELYNELQSGCPRPVLILEKPKCGRDWEFLCESCR